MKLINRNRNLDFNTYLEISFVYYYRESTGHRISKSVLAKEVTAPCATMNYTQLLQSPESRVQQVRVHEFHREYLIIGASKYSSSITNTDKN